MHTAWADWMNTLRPEDMRVHEWLAESERSTNELWFQREASRLWFDAVTFNEAQHEDDHSASEDDDDMPGLISFEDGIVAAAA